VAKFKIATPAGASFTVEGGGYDYEMEALEGMGADIVEGPTDEDGFIKFAQDADDRLTLAIRGDEGGWLVRHRRLHPKARLLQFPLQKSRTLLFVITQFSVLPYDLGRGGKVCRVLIHELEDLLVGRLLAEGP